MTQKSFYYLWLAIFVALSTLAAPAFADDGNGIQQQQGQGQEQPNEQQPEKPGRFQRLRGWVTENLFDSSQPIVPKDLQKHPGQTSPQANPQAPIDNGEGINNRPNNGDDGAALRTEGGKSKHEERLAPGEAIARFTKDLTAEAEKVYIGAGASERQVIVNLNRESVKFIAVLGPSGEGKTAMVEFIAHQLPPGYRILELNQGAFAGGTELEGRAKSRAEALMRDLAASNGKDILFVDEFHSIMKNEAFVEGIKPYTSSGKVTMIVDTTIEEWKENVSHNKAIGNRVGVVYTEPVTEAKLLQLLRAHKEKMENKRPDLKILDSTLEEIAKLTVHEYGYQSVMRKAIEIFELAVATEDVESKMGNSEFVELRKTVEELESEFRSKKSDLKVEDDPYARAELETRIKELESEISVKKNKIEEYYHESRQGANAAINELERALKSPHVSNQRKTQIEREDLPKYKKLLEKLNAEGGDNMTVIKKSHVIRQVAIMTKQTVEHLRTPPYERIQKAKEEMKKVIFNQELAIDALGDALEKREIRLSSSARPATIILDGDSGVGKSYMVDTLNKFWNGEHRPAFELNGNTYTSREDATRLIGPPPGYEGAKKGGQLTEAIFDNPRIIVRIDEIEKMHPDALKVLMQALDEGFITDANGKRIDCRRVLFIATTNASKEYVRNRNNPLWTNEYIAETYRMDINDLEGRSEKERNAAINRAALKLAGWPDELVNRWNVRIIVNQLTHADGMRITESYLKDYQKVMMRDWKIGLTWTEAVKKSITDSGFDERYGARGIRDQMETVDKPMRELVGKGLAQPRDVIDLDIKINDDKKGGTISASVNGKNAATVQNNINFQFHNTDAGKAARAAKQAQDVRDAEARRAAVEEKKNIDGIAEQMKDLGVPSGEISERRMIPRPAGKLGK